MKPKGQAQIDWAKADGRWAGAYAPQSRASPDDDLEAALDAEPSARALFDTLIQPIGTPCFIACIKPKLRRSAPRRSLRWSPNSPAEKPFIPGGDKPHDNYVALLRAVDIRVPES